MRIIDADELEQDIWDSGIVNRDEFVHLVRTSRTIERETAVKELYPIKPCPFCGNSASWVFKNIKDVTCVSIQCEVCGCQTKLFNDYDDPHLRNPKNKAIHKAARAWNRRAKATS